MGIRIVPAVLQVLAGVLLAGVLMGMIVPATGGAVSAWVAAGVTLLCVAGALLIGWWFGRSRSRPPNAAG